MAKKIGGLGKGLGAIFIENETENGESTVTLNISELEPNRNQPRREFDEEALNSLADSIKQHGLIQPILVRPILGGGYMIVAGERRYRACQIAGISEIPVIIRELTDKETMEIALIENLQRENLNPIEEAKGYRALMDDYGLTQEQVSEVIGKSRPAVANSLRLLNLPDEITVLLEQGKLSSGHARALLSFDNESEMIRVANEIALSDMSVRQIEKIAQNKKKEKPKKAPVKAPTYYSLVEQTLGEYLGTKVKVTPLKGKKGGTLSIEFYSNDDLQALAQKLEDKK
ncbi:MAG: ParB/RepB/Spo0J family partition protein [Ruminococcus sp.]|nr:ParB/RepB/Spo0J family partition protein [Ruminococcus sp.]